MCNQQHGYQVLSILFDNLTIRKPQLVSSTTIADKTGIPLPQLEELLVKMNNMGIIQTDVDLQYNLITQKGLNYLKEPSKYIPTEPLI